MSLVEKAFLIKLDRCTGCHACEIACKDENDLPPGVQRLEVKTVDVGEFNRFYVPVFAFNKRGINGCTLCPQLQAEGRRPACVDNCLTNALHFGELTMIMEQADSLPGECHQLSYLKATSIYNSKKKFNWEQVI